MPEVLPVGSVVEIISDSIPHNIPIGSVVRISHWDGDQKEPVYEVEGYITHVWFTDVKLSDDQKQQTTEPTGPAAIGAGPKYQYHVLTWGGFYNTEHKAIHQLEPGDYLFDTQEARDAFIAERRALETKLDAECLMVSLSEGFHCDVRTVLHRVSEYKGKRAYTTYDLGINYNLSTAAYHLQNKWYPGFNDYPFGDDDGIYDKGNPDFKILDEWITGATCNDSNKTGRYGHSDVEHLYL